MDVLKIGLLGVTGVMLALQFKSSKPEFGLYMGFAISLLLFSFVISGLSSVFKNIKEMEQYISRDNGYLRILLKVIGITYICEFWRLWKAYGRLQDEENNNPFYFSSFFIYGSL